MFVAAARVPPSPELSLGNSQTNSSSSSHRQTARARREYLQYARRVEEEYQRKHRRADTEENLEIARVRRSLGAVARILGRKEVAETPDAQTAVKEEYRQVTETKKAFDLRKPLEKSEILKRHPDALFVYAYCVTVEKGTQKGSLRKFKSRLVALGNNIRDARGEKFLDKLRHLLAASITSFRLLASWEVMMPDGEMKSGDTPGAYLDAKASGRPVFISLDRETQRLLTPHWLSPREPFARVDAALYGLPRSDLDCGLDSRRRVKSLEGIVHLQDHGEGGGKDEEREEGKEVEHEMKERPSGQANAHSALLVVICLQLCPLAGTKFKQCLSVSPLVLWLAPEDST